MCGIFGIISKTKGVVPFLIEGLKRLEYRGYDSAGIAVVCDEKIIDVRNAGKVSGLEKKVGNLCLESHIGIAHTRWATHGRPIEINAHPHLSHDGKIAVVHNGIIENYKDLKIELMKNGCEFKSETDTEVIPNLIEYYFKELGDEKRAVFKAIEQLKGSFAIAVLFRDDTNKFYVARKDSPLLLGFGKDAVYVASSLSAFSHLTNKVISLGDNDVAIVGLDDIDVYNQLERVERYIEEIDVEDTIVDKAGFEHFMLKEIHEQPKVVKRIINEYIDLESKKILLPKFPFDLKEVKRLTIVACGTSYYAGYVARYLFEKIAGISVDIDVASEFRYRNVPLEKDGVGLFISQSGETADTIAALKYCKERGQKIISLVNVTHSSIASLSDVVLKLVAGVEIGVASTKAFVAQMLVLALLAAETGKERGVISKKNYEKFIDELIECSESISQLFSDEFVNNVSEISKDLVDVRHIIYIGRDICYPLALEGALKLKEISYIPTQGVPAGELKHGTIALIDKKTPVVAVAPSGNELLFEKTASSIEEVAAREGQIVMISDNKGIEKISDRITRAIEIPFSENPVVSSIFSVIPMQLLAYYTALYKGSDIDKPRNLAKSVTVE